jgi:hypothetical protein
MSSDFVIRSARHRWSEDSRRGAGNLKCGPGCPLCVSGLSITRVISSHAVATCSCPYRAGSETVQQSERAFSIVGKVEPVVPAFRHTVFGYGPEASDHNSYAAHASPPLAILQQLVKIAQHSAHRCSIARVNFLSSVNQYNGYPRSGFGLVVMRKRTEVAGVDHRPRLQDPHRTSLLHTSTLSAHRNTCISFH